LMGDFNLNVRMSVAANAAMLIIIVLLLTLAQPVQAYKVQVSELPDSVPLDKETTILIAIDLEGAQSIRIEKVEAIISNPREGIIASGTFDANGTIIDDGGFIVSVSLINGTIDQSWGYDNATGIVYSVKILLKSSDFQASEGNEFTVIVYRGLLSNPLRSPSVIFNITEVNPWPTVILGVGVAEATIFLGVFYAFRKRRKSRKRKLRKK
jgi:hypothetical protein